MYKEVDFNKKRNIIRAIEIVYNYKLEYVRTKFINKKV